MEFFSQFAKAKDRTRIDLTILQLILQRTELEQIDLLQEVPTVVDDNVRPSPAESYSVPSNSSTMRESIEEVACPACKSPSSKDSLVDTARPCLSLRRPRLPTNSSPNQKRRPRLTQMLGHIVQLTIQEQNRAPTRILIAPAASNEFDLVRPHLMQKASLTVLQPNKKG